MRLEIDGSASASAAEADIRKALATPILTRDWSLTLARDDANLIEADRIAADRFMLTLIEYGTLLQASRNVDRAELQAILLAYREGGSGWRRRLDWKPLSPPPGPASTARTPRDWRQFHPLVALAAMLIAFWVVFPLLGRLAAALPWERLPIPAWMDSTVARLILGFFAACVALFVVALVVKLLEVRKARRWPKVTGRIVRSEAPVELVQRDRESMPVNERVLRIAYEYAVGGKTYRGTRVSLAERISEPEIDAYLSLYPVGKTVDVFHDPAKPDDAVLERDLPGLALGCLGMLAAGIVGIAGLMWLVTAAPAFIQTYLPRAVVPLFVIFSLGATFLLLLAAALGRDALRARTWPTVTGVVTLSEVRAFERLERSGSRGRSRIRRSHMPLVEYAYKVRAKPYTGRSIKLDTQEAGSEAFARKVAALYPVGRVVKVRYDPADPARATLETSYFVLVILGGLGLVLLALAVWASGHFAAAPPLRLGR